MREKRSLMRRNAMTSMEKTTMEVTKEAAKALADCPEELAAASGRGAGSTADFCGVLEGDLLLRVPGSDALDLARVFAVFGKQGDSAGD